jgi:hypothetical protein
VLLRSGEESPITAEESARSVVDHKLSFEIVPSPRDRFVYGKVISDIRYDVVRLRHPPSSLASLIVIDAPTYFPSPLALPYSN